MRRATARVRGVAGGASPAAGARPRSTGVCGRVARRVSGSRPTTRRPGRPATAPEDVEAAGLYDNLINWLFADPILLGRVPRRARRGDARAGRRGPGDHLDADRLLRAQPLRAGPGRCADRQPGHGRDRRHPDPRRPAVRAADDGRLPEDRLRLADRSRRRSARSCGPSRPGTATSCRRSTSPRTAARSTTDRWTAWSTTSAGSTTWTAICGR